MMRTTFVAAVVMAIAIAACGGGNKHPVNPPATPPAKSASESSSRAGDVVLSVSGIGSFHARCPRGASSWTLRFVADLATDTFSYRVGTGPRRTVQINTGTPAVIKLVPDAARTREPPDRFVPFTAQTKAASVPTTLPLDALIYQATEPQTLVTDVHLALAAIGGENGQCVLVDSAVRAYAYPT
jgi:hypothetical protein